jgi:hypothetical protein
MASVVPGRPEFEACGAAFDEVDESGDNGGMAAKRAGVIVVALVTAFGLAACDRGGHKARSTRAGSLSRSVSTSTTRTAPSKHELAQKYLRIIRPASSALARFDAKAQRWDYGTSGPAAAEDAAPAIAATKEADRNLLRTHWPSRVARDIRALVQADGALIGVMQSVATLTDAASLDWANHFAQAVEKVSAASNGVRADLGLPKG